MWLLMFFVAPLLGVATGWWWMASHGYPYRRGVLFITLLPTAIAAVGLTFLVIKSSHWRDGRELVWLANEATTPGNVLVLGGERAGSTLGWPTGFSWPQVTLRDATGAVAVEVRGGGGLVTVDGVAVNGRVLGGSDETVRDFRLRVVTNWLWVRRIEIRAAGPVQPPPAADRWQRWIGALLSGSPDPPLVAYSLTIPLSHVSPVTGRVARTVLGLRRRNAPGDLGLALALEQWAAAIRLYVTDSEVRVLDEADTSSVATHTTRGSTASLEVHWPRRVLRGSVGQLGGRLQLRFEPPWSQTSPLPPRPKPGESVLLTLTNVPEPGDLVFALPFGTERSVRASMRILDDPKRGDVFQNEAGWTRTIITPPGTSRVQHLRTYGVERVQSDTCVTVGDSRPCLGIVQDVLRAKPLFAVLIVALVMLGFGVAAAEAVVRDLPYLTWTFALLLSAFWNILATRLLLALRYALDPAGLDAMAVEGVVNAVMALVAVPASLAGAVAVYREKYQARERPETRVRFTGALAVLAFVLLAAYGSGRYALGLWPNLPDRFDPGVVTGGSLLLVALWITGVSAIVFYIGFGPEARTRRWLWDLALNVPLRFLAASGRLWSGSEALDAPGFVGFWWRKAVLLGLVLLAFVVAARAGGGVKLTTELLYPLVVGISSVVFWLGSLHAFPPTINLRRHPLPRWKPLVGLTLIFAVLPGVAPVAFGDPGALYSMLGILLVTGLLLVTSRHRRFGWAVLSGCAVMVLALWMVTTNASALPAPVITLFGRGAARVTAYMHGSDVQRMLPLSQAQSNTGDGLPADALRGALEHPWEAAAIVYRGNWTGVGFGAAPTRRSNIPQDVLQYDSTVAFFVAGDHGVYGVVALFLLYLVPLGALLPGARRHFDTGYALAIVAASWLVVEAVIHATVNLGMLPFTGRNLPWLSVQSSSDLIRWTAMAFLIVHATLWRTTGSEFRYASAVELVTDASPPSPQQSAAAMPATGAGPGSSVAVAPATLVRRRWVPGAIARLWAPGLRPMVASAGVVIVLVAGLVVYPAIGVIHDGTYAEPFTWREYFDQVQRYLNEGKVRWDADSWTLDPSPLRDEGLDLRGTSLLEQEIARFNALPRDAKSDLPESLATELRAVRTVQDYDHMLLAAAGRDRIRTPGPVTLFRVEERTVLRDDGTSRTEQFPIVDRSLDASVSFGEDTNPQALPTVRYRPTLTGQPGPVIVGPAWVNGRWHTAYAPDQRLPWGASLAAGVQGIWNNRSYTNLRDRFAAVTIDPALQQQAVEFVAEKSRGRHGELLAMGIHRSTPVLALPPRVALSVITIPSGEVLALGGWPALSASNTWQMQANGVLPPAEWLEVRAPRALAYRYLGDRNFDPIEMGSATKPIWAAAAVRIHPGLPRALRTRGPEEDEREVFGIRIANDGWTTHARDWTPFRTYMAVSDNRYHVRVGFLALAEGVNGLPVADARTGSTRESFAIRNGVEVVWGRAPRFDPTIGFSPAAPAEFHDLHLTRLAGELRQMFGISVRAGDFRTHRRSFWSLDEADDRLLDRKTLPEGFAALSPVVPAFHLDQVSSPREYVNLLVGGGTNRWANVDFAAAFATAVTGHPVVARAVPGAVTIDPQARVSFEPTAAQLRDALRDVVTSGTATAAMGQMSNWFRANGVSVYAKTGTLSTDRGRTETSRLVVALVRWRNEARGEAAGGVVLSLVVERADTGVAARWLGEFIARHRDTLLRYVQAPTRP